MEQISIQEAHEQLQACTDEVGRIRSKLAELQAENSVPVLARRERELADQLLEGGDLATIVAPPMTSAQLRHAINVLEGRLAEALDLQNQARGAVRRANLNRMRELLRAEREAYDEAAQKVMHRWLRATALANAVDAVTGVSSMSAPWYRLKLPRGIEPKTHNNYEDVSSYPDSQTLLAGVQANLARTEIAALLNAELNAEGIK